MCIRNPLNSHTGNSFNQGLRRHVFVVCIQSVKLLLFPLNHVSSTCPASILSSSYPSFTFLFPASSYLLLKLPFPFHSSIFFLSFLPHCLFRILLVLLAFFSSFILLRHNIFKFALLFVWGAIGNSDRYGISLRPFCTKPWPCPYSLLTGHWKIIKSVQTWLHVQ